MTMPRDIYHKDAGLERLDKKIRAANIDEASKEKLLEYKRYLFLAGLGKLRIMKHLYLALRIRHMLKKPFSRTTKQDIIRVIEEVEKSDFKPWTKHDYRLVMKKFYKWLRGVEKPGIYPPEVEWISLGMRNNNHRLPDEILTVEEVKQIAEVATHPRDKALVAVLYESGCRVGELLNLRLKHVEFDDYGAVMIVDGKTGMRRVRLVASAPALAVWMDSHPLKKDKEAPLWVNIRSAKPLDYAGCHKLLRVLAKKAKITKPVNPHSFRHARATHLASNLTEAQMKEVFGWVQASKMAAVYVHLSGRDVDSALLELYGLKKKEDAKGLKLDVKVCPRCHEKNSWDSEFCKRCALVLDIEAAKEMERATTTLDKLLEDPRARKYLLQRLYEMKTRAH